MTIRHALLGHRPAAQSGFDGLSLTNRCGECGKRLLMDSQGNWFDVPDHSTPDSGMGSDEV